MKNPINNTEKAHASNPPMLDEHLHPIGSGMQMGSFKGQVPWQFAHQQRLNVKNVVASNGYFKNIIVSGGGTIPLSGGTLADYFYNMGTIANSEIEGGTINTSIFEGGTINGITSEGGTMNNGIYGAPLINGGTHNNAILGSPIITGGLINPGTYQTGGTVGASGSIVYIKSVNFAGSTTTLGTLQFNNGLITSFS